MRGRRPKPTQLKLITGITKASRLNHHEPKPLAEIPDPPNTLTPAARAEWKRVCTELCQLGMLSKLDRAVLAAYCQAYGRWHQADRSIAAAAKKNPTTGGLVLFSPAGGAYQNPMLSISVRASADMVKFAAELGMTPSSRSRIDLSKVTRGVLPASVPPPANQSRTDAPIKKYLTSV
jgi:P27 family predicted phage terminase small subunit